MTNKMSKQRFQADFRLKELIVLKLKEFDAYIADELPAYILVMLDNKKPWKDITQELEVFLVESTEPFVEWLKGEVDTQVAKKAVEREQKSDLETPSPTLKSSRVADVRSEKKSIRQPPSLQNHQSKESPVAKEEVPVAKEEVPVAKEEVSVAKKRGTSHHSSQHGKNNKRPSYKGASGRDDISLSLHVEQDDLIVGAGSSKGRGQRDSQHKQLSSDDDEVDQKRVHSKVVRVVERERPRLSTNSRLLKRAMDDVYSGSKHLSTSEGERKVRSSVPVRREESSSESRSDLRSIIKRKRDRKKSPNKMSAEDLDSRTKIKDGDAELAPNESLLPDSGSKDKPDNMEAVETSEEKTRPQKLKLTKLRRSEKKLLEQKTSSDSKAKRPRLVMTESGLRTYKSLVLNGDILDSEYQRMRGSEGSSDEDLGEGVMPLDKMSPTQEGNTGQSKLDRCRFWPNCKHGDSCPYLHPSVACKSFPNCRFGNKCHFIHPTCKYDGRCSRSDCPYLHTAPKKIATSVSPFPVIPTTGFGFGGVFPSAGPGFHSGRGYGKRKPAKADRSSFVWTPGKEGVSTSNDS